MKTKVAVFAVLTLWAGSVFAGGPVISVNVGGNHGWCPPAAYCPPVAYRPFPAYYGFSPLAYYYGSSYVGYSGGYRSSFSNYSPLMDYQATTPVYQVPAPVIPAEPLTVYPGPSFGWKR